jgi:hypothetical protein
MNRLIFTLLSLFLGITLQAQSSVQLVSETAGSIQVQVNVEGYQSISVETTEGPAQIISLEEGTPILKAGAPDLAKLTFSLAIEDQANTALVVDAGDYTDIPNVTVAPSKGNLYRNVDPASVPFAQDAGIYEVDAFYPGNLAALRNPYVFRDFRGQTVVVYPLQYNPVSKVLRVYHNIQVTVKTVPGTPVNPLPAADRRVTQSHELLYQKRFLNYGSVEDRYPEVGELGNMLIISHGDYLPLLEDYVRWKREKGIITELVDVADIGNDEASIAAYVADYYQNEGLTYLLLVGDENTVATAQTSSNNACDHCYGYLEGTDHYAEIFVGRFNAETADQVQTMVDRTLEYEKDPYLDNPDWFGTALGNGSAEGPGDEGEYDYEHLNNIKSELLDYTYHSVWEFYDGSQADVSPTPGTVYEDGDGNPSNTAIAAAINEGLTIYNFTGHGGHSGLASGNFNVNTVYNVLDNTGMYPFMIAVACCVGDFQNDFGAGDCLGDSWIRAAHSVTGEPTGGIGGLFSSILQSWSPPMEGQDEMMKLLTENGATATRHTIGGIAIHGIGSMIDGYGGGGDAMADTWNIFGDPSVQLWTDTPVSMTVSHVPVVNVGASQLTVTCDVEDALIGLYYQGDVLGSGVVSGGTVTIDFDPVLIPEAITVTATAHNRLPYQGEVLVEVVQGPYVGLEEVIIQDPTGDNDNQADYGEEIELDVKLENLGPVTAPSVVATLSTVDPNVNILSDVSLYGDMASAEEILMQNAFLFTVADDVDDQYVVPFDLVVESGSDVWSFPISITLQAPVLDTEEEPVTTEVIGNANGRWDSGETMELDILSLNTGYAASLEATGTLSCASPYITITDPEVNLGTIEALVGMVPANYEIIIANDVPTMTTVVFEYLVEAGNYAATRSFEVVINQIVEDFESNDFSMFDWSPDGELPWFTTDVEVYVGEVSSQSGGISDNQSTTMMMEIDVLEAGEVSFARKVSSEQGWDFLRFYIDGNLMGEWSGELDWAEETYSISTGAHVLVWTYEKDQIFSAGEDAAWVDEIILPLIEQEDPSATFARRGNDNILVWPNPATDVLFVQSNNPAYQIKGWRLLNVQGQPMAEQTVTLGLQHELDVSALTPGIYYLQVFTEQGPVIQKIVVL